MQSIAQNQFIRTLLIVVFPLLSIACGPHETPLENGRLVKTINRDWTFNYFPHQELDTTVVLPEYDDAQWPAIAVPHTWSTYETTGEVHPFIRNAAETDDEYWWYGWGIYRKKLHIDSRYLDNLITVEFDGVQKFSRFWVNGIFIGEHKGGFSSFSFDISKAVRFNKENVLVMTVSNRRDDDFGHIPPMTAGNWNVYGGIYRDVRLVIRNRLHIPFQGSAEHEGGTFVTTPRVSEQEGIARVRTFVRNSHEVPVDCRLVTSIWDADGVHLQSFETSAKISSGTIHEFDQTSAPIQHPQLWSPDSPYLYSVRSAVFEDDYLADRYESPLGFRWFRWDYNENRLYVNDRLQPLHGTNRHQEYPWLGDAMPQWLHVRDFEDIKVNLGHNFMRTCHYTQDPMWYNLCDRQGIIVVEEVPNIKHIDFGEDIQEQNVREMIRRDRNHPSIFFWSMGNETSDAADSRWAWEEDTTRIIHLRKGESGGDYVQHTDKNMDLENLLRCTIRGWYDRDDRDLQPENGQHAGTEEWQHLMARTQDGSIRGRIDMNGVMWVYADHGADREYRYSPLKHINPKGWVDAYRFPKYLYYLWQAHYSRKDVMFIHPHFWRAPYIGTSREIMVDSNCEEVELFVNGVSAGRQRPAKENFFTVTFKRVPVQRGTLSAEGIRNGRKVRTSVIMAGTPSRLVLTASHDTITADRAGIAVISADIVDQDGVHVYGADNPIHWNVNGPATLIGPAVYTSDRDKSEAMDGVMYIDAPVSNLVRSTTQTGRVTVTASSPGLETGEVVLIAAAPADDAVPGIMEPLLSPDGRLPVHRDTSITAGLEGSVQGALHEIRVDLQLKAGTVVEYNALLNDFLKVQNPGLDTASIAYQAFSERLVRTMMASDGILIADEANFQIRRFNTCYKITMYIHSLSIPPILKESLMEYYTEVMVRRGTDLRDGDEIQRIQQVVSTLTAMRGKLSYEDIEKVLH